MIKNNVSIFGHHSIWCIFKKIVSQLIATNQSNLIEMLDWTVLKNKLEKWHEENVLLEQIFLIVDHNDLNKPRKVSDVVNSFAKENDIINLQIKEIKLLI